MSPASFLSLAHDNVYILFISRWCSLCFYICTIKYFLIRSAHLGKKICSRYIGRWWTTVVHCHYRHRHTLRLTGVQPTKDKNFCTWASHVYFILWSPKTCYSGLSFTLFSLFFSFYAKQKKIPYLHVDPHGDWTNNPADPLLICIRDDLHMEIPYHGEDVLRCL